MTRSSPILTNFTAGVFSPLLYGRVDIQKYANGCKQLENFIPLKHGAVTRRGGSYFVAEVKDSTKKVKLIPFVFSVSDSFILEFGHNYIRFYTNFGQVQSGSNPLEISTTYTETQVQDIKIAQSADVLYIAHPEHPPRKLLRLSATNWSLVDVDIQDGPFYPTNTTATNFSFDSGYTTLTASAVTGINNDEGFKATDVGRLVRFEDSSNNWSSFKITGFTSTKVVTVVKQGELPSSASGTTGWRLGAFSATTGYPSLVTFFEQRLIWGATQDLPQTVFFSKSADFETYSPTTRTGTVADDNGFVYTVGSDQVNTIRWLVSANTLSLGTEGGEFTMRTGSGANPITPTNAKAVRQSNFGSSKVTPILVGSKSLFVQRAKRKLREYAYQFENDAYTAADLTILAEHITESGIKELAYQQEPHSLLWGVLENGNLISCTYDRPQDVVGWANHSLGGTDAKVENVAVIPSSTQDNLFIVVSRTIGGVTKRYIEYITKGLSDTATDTKQATFLDSMLTYDGSPVTTVSNLEHLNGQTVGILVDGAVHTSQVVANGSVSLNYSGSVVQVGLKFTSTLETLDIEAGSPDGTAQGKLKRFSTVIFRLFKTVGFDFGSNDNDKMPKKPFRKGEDKMGNAVSLFTGDKKVDFPLSDNENGCIILKQEQPLPLTLIAIMPQLTVNRA